MNPTVYVLNGAIVLGYWVIGLFFLKFWRDTRDRLFAYFWVAFWIMSLERVGVVYLGAHQESGPVVYLGRILAFALIAFGIIHKNR